MSIIINYNYSFKQNIIQAIYWVLYFIVLYTVKNNEDLNKTQRDVQTFLKIFVCYATIEVISSLVLFISDYSEKIVTADTQYEYYIGFAIGRLWGSFINPNTGAVIAAMAIIIFVYLFIATKNIMLRVVYSLGIILQFLYIVFSDSRTGVVCLGVVVGVFALIMLLFKFREKTIAFKCAMVVVACLIGLGIGALPRQTKTLYNNTVVKIVEGLNDNQNEEQHKDNLIERGYDLTDDISNRRFDVWKGAAELYVDSFKTFTVGCTYGGFSEYAQKNQPNNYLVNNDYDIFKTLDNEFFNIMCAQGTIGLVCTSIFVLFVIVCVFKKINLRRRKTKEEVMEIAISLALLVGLVAAAMFRSIMFYHFSPNAILFWFILGKMIHLLSFECKENV